MAEIRPNQSCVPGDLHGAAGWFQNWSDQMQTEGANLGFAAAETDREQADQWQVWVRKAGSGS